MSPLEEKYKNFKVSLEFPTLYSICWHDAKGNFKSFATELGYTNFKDFQKDFQTLNNKIEAYSYTIKL